MSAVGLVDHPVYHKYRVVAARKRWPPAAGRAPQDEKDVVRQSCPWYDASRIRYTRVLCRRLLRVAEGLVRVVRVHAAVPAQRVPAMGPQVHAVPFGRRPVAAHAVPAQRPDTPGQAAVQSCRRVPAEPGAQLFRILYRQRRTQFQPVLLVLSRSGNRIQRYDKIKLTKIYRILFIIRRRFT